MKLAILGVGNVGAALATAALAAGHQVTVASAHPEKAQAVATGIGAQSARTVRDAARGADLVVLAVPYGAIGDVVRDLGDAVDGRILVDVTNPLNATYTDLASASSAAQELAALAPRARVVKAFNTLFASRHGQPAQDGAPLDAFFAGDDASAKARVAELATSLGYRPIDVGGLHMARFLEATAFLNISLNARNNWSWQSAWRLVGPTA